MNEAGFFYFPVWIAIHFGKKQNKTKSHLQDWYHTILAYNFILKIFKNVLKDGQLLNFKADILC